MAETGNRLEVSATCAEHPVRALRYTVDGTAAIQVPSDRLRAGDAITRGALERLESPAGLGVHDTVQAAIMNPHASHPAFADFAIWHGAIHTPDGGCVLKAYYNLRPWRLMPDRLRDALSAIETLGPVERLFALDQSPMTWPCFLGVEYDQGGVHATKLYWQRQVPMFPTEPRHRAARLIARAPFEALDGATRILLNGAAAFPAPAVVMSGKVSPRNDHREAGIPVSLPACCPDDDAAADRVRAILECASLDGGPYERSWAALAGQARGQHMVHSVVAIVMAADRARVTAYFDPPSGITEPVRPAENPDAAAPHPSRAADGGS